MDDRLTRVREDTGPGRDALTGLHLKVAGRDTGDRQGKNLRVRQSDGTAGLARLAALRGSSSQQDETLEKGCVD